MRCQHCGLTFATPERAARHDCWWRPGYILTRGIGTPDMTETADQTPEPEFCYRKTHNEERRDCGCSACLASLEADNAE